MCMVGWRWIANEIVSSDWFSYCQTPNYCSFHWLFFNIYIWLCVQLYIYSSSAFYCSQAGTCFHGTRELLLDEEGSIPQKGVAFPMKYVKFFPDVVVALKYLGIFIFRFYCVQIFGFLLNIMKNLQNKLINKWRRQSLKIRTLFVVSKTCLDIIGSTHSFFSFFFSNCA